MVEFFMAASGLLASIIILLILVALPIAAYQLQTARLDMSRLLWEEFHRLHGKEVGHD